MGTDRGERMLSHPDQWARCAHQGTALLAGGGVELNWSDEPDPAAGCRAEPAPSGLAFDRWCRAYRSRRSVVEVYPVREPPRPAPCPGGLQAPLGLAVDPLQRLYVVESSAHAVLVVDLWTGRLLRRIRLGRIRPRDVSADCGRVWLLADEPGGPGGAAALLTLDGRRAPRPGPAVLAPRCAARLRASRIAEGPLVLWTGAGAGLIATPAGSVVLEVDGATDLAMVDGVLAVARQPGQSIRRFQPDGSAGTSTTQAGATGTEAAWTELEPVGAPGYDGGAIAASRGRIAYTTEAGYRTTIGPVGRHANSGTVTTYRLDSGSYRNRWGRLFLDACLPLDTAVGVRFLTSDADDVEDPIPAQPPERGGRTVPHPESTPPLPSATLLAAADPPTVLFRRPGGAEQSWSMRSGTAPPGDSATYEAPVAAPPGRYLWVQLLLTGTDRVTPRVRALRVESIDHGLLATLPRSWSRSEPNAQFLHRFLTPIDGVLHDLDWRAAQRAILLDPQVTPAEALDWLAGFAGLVLDARWPEDARRTLVAEAYQLFARRGTKAALIRILEIFLGRPPQIIEQWQLRGLGGAVLGEPLGTPAPAIGSGQQAGTLGRFALGGAGTGGDSYRLAAHRFTVLVPGTLTPVQRVVVAEILDGHRPAHTAYQVCELGSGMRVGERLRVALTSFVGPGAGWQRAVVGSTGVGTDGVVGTPAIGSRLGADSVTGQVRVG
jgi:phage tail-like protein